MKARGFRNAAIGFGLATGLSIAVVGNNTGEVVGAERAVGASYEGTPQAEDADYDRDLAYTLLLESIGVACVFGAATYVANDARKNAIAGQEAAMAQSTPTEF